MSKETWNYTNPPRDSEQYIWIMPRDIDVNDPDAAIVILVRYHGGGMWVDDYGTFYFANNIYAWQRAERPEPAEMVYE